MILDANTLSKGLILPIALQVCAVENVGFTDMKEPN